MSMDWRNLLTRRTLLMVVVGAVAGFAGVLLYQNYERQQFGGIFEPIQKERYFDVDAIREARMRTGLLSAEVTGTVVNNSWKKRSIGVWAGFVKPDGFHQGAGSRRSYYGYQYFPDVEPNDTRTFSIPVAMAINREWSAIAEFDPKSEHSRPEWK